MKHEVRYNRNGKLYGTCETERDFLEIFPGAVKIITYFSNANYLTTVSYFFTGDMIYALAFHGSYFHFTPVDYERWPNIVEKFRNRPHLFVLDGTSEINTSNSQ